VKEFGQRDGAAGALAVEEQQLGDILERHSDQVTANQQAETVDARGRLGETQQAEIACVQMVHGRQIPRRLPRAKATSWRVSRVGISVSMRASASASFSPQR